MKIRFVGTTGNGWSSDLAIDNIRFSEISCLGGTKTWDGANWSPIGNPDNTNAVVINGNYDTNIHGNIDGMLSYRKRRVCFRCLCR